MSSLTTRTSTRRSPRSTPDLGGAGDRHHQRRRLRQRDAAQEADRDPHPGGLVQGLLDDVPEVVLVAVDRLVSRWKDPPRSPAEIVALVSAHPSMAEPMAQMRTLLDG